MKKTIKIKIYWSYNKFEYKLLKIAYLHIQTCDDINIFINTLIY